MWPSKLGPITVVAARLVRMRFSWSNLFPLDTLTTTGEDKTFTPIAFDAAGAVVPDGGSDEEEDDWRDGWLGRIGGGGWFGSAPPRQVLIRDLLAES